MTRGAASLFLIVLAGSAGCNPSTEPDSSGHLGYARFSGVFRSPIGHAVPSPVVGTSVAIVCGVNLLVEYFGNSATTGADGSFSVDVDIPGNLNNPAPNRKYSCLIEGTDPATPSSPACNRVEVTFAGSESKRPVFTSNLTAGQYACSLL